MTQYNQVVAAIKKLGGKGNLAQIMANIKDIGNWTTKTPDRTVYSLLYKSNEFEKKDNIWYYTKLKTPSTKSVKKKTSPVKQAATGGLYLLGLNPNLEHPYKGLLFKIGRTDREFEKRLNEYDLYLPFSPIQLIDTYIIPNKKILVALEKNVRNTLIKDSLMGFPVKKFSAAVNDKKTEWLHIQNIKNTDSIMPDLKKAIQKVINAELAKLQK